MTLEVAHRHKKNCRRNLESNLGLYGHRFLEPVSGAERVYVRGHRVVLVLQVSGRVVIKFGARPGEAIIQQATMEHATMIVMGTRGLGFIRRTILGSVSDYVLHHAHCPVAVCSHHGMHK